jgi:hypothetical protein
MYKKEYQRRRVIRKVISFLFSSNQNPNEEMPWKPQLYNHTANYRTTVNRTEPQHEASLAAL